MAVAEKKAVSLQEVYQGYADKATEKEATIVSLLDQHNVKFTSDFRDVKAGTVFKGISQVAFDFYNANNVVEKLK